MNSMETSELAADGTEIQVKDHSPAAAPTDLLSLEPIQLGRHQLRGRNFLLGNKQGLMLHLPAANGATRRTIHRSKWYGASRFGRKFLEALACETETGQMLSRRNQDGFMTDGIVAERSYLVDGLPLTERYFMPDGLPTVIWTQEGTARLSVDPYLDLRYYRGSAGYHACHAEMSGGMLVVWRDIEMTGPGEGPEGRDTGGSPEPVGETLWVACAVHNGEIELNRQTSRWRPIWYGLDAARRRYLRRVGLSEAEVAEHAPRWELASEWIYAPGRIRTSDGTVVALGFGGSLTEAVEAAESGIEGRERLMAEKRGRLDQLMRRSWFSCGHPITDQAYSHVVSRLSDCLVVSSLERREDGTSPVEAAAILAGDAYFQEAWKRDENISLGGILATGQHELARTIIDSTWQRQDEVTGRLPLRLRVGETPGYTSSDGTLWALLRLTQYSRMTGDLETLHSKLPLIAYFFRQSLAHSWQGLLPSGGVAVPEHEWETWMDTEFSARSGYPIEIQLMWLVALETLAAPVAELDPELSRQMEQAAEDLTLSLELFRREDHFVDHLTPALEPIDLLTPNGYFWTILGLYLGGEWEERSLTLARRELSGVSGIRTLARSQWESVLGHQIAALARGGRPLPSVGKVNYHRGVEWNWLSQLFVAGELRYGRPDMAFDHYLARQIHDAVNTAGLGGISEVFDHRGPAGPDFQAWSMTSLLESIHRFVGVNVDVSSGSIRISPKKPRHWPYIRARKWYSARSFDVDYAVSRNRQELVVDFGSAGPLPEIELVIELNLQPGCLPQHLIRTGPDGEEELQDWIVQDGPSRVMLRLQAESWQRILLLT